MSHLNYCKSPNSSSWIPRYNAFSLKKQDCFKNANQLTSLLSFQPAKIFSLYSQENSAYLVASMRPYRPAKLPDLIGIIFSLLTMIHTHWLSLWPQDMPNSFALICTSPSTWHTSAFKSSHWQIFIQVLVQISPQRLLITSPSCSLSHHPTLLRTLITIWSYPACYLFVICMPPLESKLSKSKDLGCLVHCWVTGT